MGVTHPEIDRSAKLISPTSGELEHRWAEIDSRLLKVGPIEGQVTAGADAYLQNSARRLRADPLPPTTEEKPLEQRDARVITGRELLPDSEDPLCFVLHGKLAGVIYIPSQTNFAVQLTPRATRASVMTIRRHLGDTPSRGVLPDTRT